MISEMFGRKIKQTQAFTDTGQRIPVTIIHVPGHKVSQIKTREKEGYIAIKVFLKEEKAMTKKPLFREIRVGKEDLPAIGSEITLPSVFKSNDTISVSGTTKGKGFQGVVKRHGFKGGPKTHGQSDRHRAPGSIGSTTTPGRVYKGKRMAGHMGGKRATIRGLKIFEVKEDQNQLIVKGLIPGHRNNLMRIKKQ